MSLSRFALRLSGSRILSSASKASSPRATLASVASSQRVAPSIPSPAWSSAIASRGFATKADEDLVTFLTDEIKAEKGNQKNLPSLDGFNVEAEGAELRFVKNFDNEKIIVQLNVNHTVDSAEPDDGAQESPEMKSRPTFEVDITKGASKTLSFSCSYIHQHDGQQAEAQEEGFEDVFAIDEVTLYEGEWNDKKYAVAGDILDGYLYDLFMNMLDERGVNKAFAEKLSAYCSSYEHSQYIALLEGLQKFVKQ